MHGMQGDFRSHYNGLKVLVTGADGFIGSHLTEVLASRGAIVTALALYNSFDSHGWLDDLPPATRSKLNLVRGDIRDSTFIHRLMKRQEMVFHLAALIGIPYSYVAAQCYVDTNVLGTLNMLEAARANDILRIVHTSTSEVYGTALWAPITESHPLQGQSPYSASKIGADMMAEAFARSFDLRVAILRPFNTFGPRQSERAVIPTILRQTLDPRCRTIKIGDTTPERDFMFVDDTVAAFLAIGTASGIEFGRPYNAGSCKSVTVSQLIELVRELTDCRKPLEHEPGRIRPPQSEVRALLADSTRLTAVSGWRPETDLREGLKRTIAWWRDRLVSGRLRQDADFVA